MYKFLISLDERFIGSLSVAEKIAILFVLFVKKMYDFTTSIGTAEFYEYARERGYALMHAPNNLPTFMKVIFQFLSI